MRRILKYKLAPTPWQVQRLALTGQSAKVLSVGEQDDVVVVWVDEDVDIVQERGHLDLMLVFTGQAPPLDGRFVGTVTTPSNGLVWHLWEIVA
jgi:hypothetical protein